MHPGIDQDVANEFMLSLSVMITVGMDQTIAPNPRPSMFTYAAVGEDHDFTDSARKEGMDIVCLCFEPGRELKGPVHVDVFEERLGKVTAWRRCTPWAWTKDGPYFLIAEESDTGFAYDGASLVMIWSLPTDDIPARVDLGRVILHLMRSRIPADALKRSQTRRLR